MRSQNNLKTRNLWTLISLDLEIAPLAHHLRPIFGHHHALCQRHHDDVDGDGNGGNGRDDDDRDGDSGNGDGDGGNGIDDGDVDDGEDL